MVGIGGRAAQGVAETVVAAGLALDDPVTAGKNVYEVGKKVVQQFDEGVEIGMGRGLQAVYEHVDARAQEIAEAEARGDSFEAGRLKGKAVLDAVGVALGIQQAAKAGVKILTRKKGIVLEDGNQLSPSQGRPPRESYPVGERLPDGRIAGEGPGAARRGGSEFSSGGTQATDLRRPHIRRGVRVEAEARAPRTAEGKPIDPNTLQPIEGKPDLGHRFGREFRREKAKAQAEGLSQEEFNRRMNDPDLYQLEELSSNRSHRFEKPGSD